MVLTGRASRPSRRWLLGASLAAAPLAFGAAAFARRVRATLVGARDFADSRVDVAGIADSFPRTVWGPTGEARELPRPPQRIVSAYLGSDEVLASLIGPRRIVAVSAYCDDRATSNCLGVYPPAILRLHNEIDLEAIVATEPDLVCVAGFTQPDALRLLAGSGLPLVRWSRFDSLADVTAHAQMLGAAVGADRAAAALVAGIDGLLHDLAARLRGARPVRVLFFDPPAYTMGPRTLVGDLLSRAGAVNAAAEIGVMGAEQIGIETVLGLDPEAIIVPRYPDNDNAVRALGANRLWGQVPAVKAGRLFEVPGAWISTVSHHAARGLAHIARLLHPDRFAE
jgi:iron complex transport system substrate-binding protein